MKNIYLQPKVAASYEQERLNSNYKRYKHYSEVRALLDCLVSGKKTEILEVGCGTGRITQELTKKGFSVTPTDVSPAMLAEFVKKKDLPKPILTKGSSLPFPKKSYQTIVSIRVIWHILDKERNKLLTELFRVSSKDIIADFTNQERVKNRIIKALTFIFTKIFPQNYKVYEETYFFDMKQLERFLVGKEAKIEKSIPLDTIIPVWLDLLPENFARRLYPFLFNLDRLAAKILPPTRYLLKISKHI